nr:alkaline phosphatase-like [Danaus plexippus plexippus]
MLLGTTGPSKYDGLNYTVISYGTGGPGSFKHSMTTIDNVTRVVRRDPSAVNTDDMLYEQIAAITLEENKHGGNDVTVYAKGPFSHLFHNVHEQHYVFHAISYAAKLGVYSSGDSIRHSVAIIAVVLLPLLKLL